MNNYYYQQELYRLTKNTLAENISQSYGVIELSVVCKNVNAVNVLQKLVDVMIVVAENSINSWPETSEWHKLLPKWFVESFRLPYTEEEMKTELARWRKLSQADQEDYEKNVTWDMHNWMHAMSPRSRAWFWYDGTVINNSLLNIKILVSEYPFPYDNLRFLALASGALDVIVSSPKSGTDLN